MSGLTIGGQSAWRVRSKGDIGVAFHWVKDEPSAVFYPLNRGMRLYGGMPYVMPLSVAHELVKDGSGGVEVDSAVLVEKATKAAEVMGAVGDAFIIRTIADAMLEALDDLCDMPPHPAKGQVQREEGLVQFRANGRTLWEKDASELQST
jgi:hypothetical protein